VDLVGDNHVEPREAGQPAEEIEVGGPHRVVRRTVGHGDDDVIEGSALRRRAATRSVLIEAPVDAASRS
jgi:hypothetical protein